MNRPGPSLHVVSSRISLTSAAGKTVVVRPRDQARDVDDVDARVLEEDTNLILSAPAILPDIEEHPVRLMTDLIEAPVHEPGAVLVRGRRRRLRFLAVVYDIEQAPIWQPAWVSAALAHILAEAERHSVRTLSCPVLPSAHGRIAPETFVSMLVAAIEDSRVSTLDTLWLAVPADRITELHQALATAVSDRPQ